MKKSLLKYLLYTTDFSGFQLYFDPVRMLRGFGKDALDESLGQGAGSLVLFLYNGYFLPHFNVAPVSAVQLIFAHGIYGCSGFFGCGGCSGNERNKNNHSNYNKFFRSNQS